MINYSIYVNNIFRSTLQANSRSEAVNMANDLYNCAGIHVSVPSQWAIR